MIDDFEACYRACQARDQRFDGWFFVGVTSTGIYCRPSCPAMTPKRRNVVFHPSAASAQRAGFRACKRCRPDVAPGSPEWDRRADVVARAVRLIADGTVDREGVEGLARRLGYGTRQLERLVQAELGAGPLALARAQRAQTARTLIETTALPFSTVAFAAGFASIRQFNDTVREVFASTPTELRKRRRPEAPAAGGGQWIPLRLAVREPFDGDGLLARLAGQAVEGIEAVDAEAGTLWRSLSMPNGQAVVALTPRATHVDARIQLEDVADLTAAVTRCRWLLDLDADPVAVDRQLGADQWLAPAVAEAAGTRVARSVDGGELVVRAVLSQQVSTAGARSRVAGLVQALGEPLRVPAGRLTRVFPAMPALAGADDALIGGPARRCRTVRSVAAAVASGDLVLGPGADRHDADRRLAEIDGVGPWTRAVAAMRASGDPDAWPSGDLGVRRGAARLDPELASALPEAAERWRPWRSYAAAHLWRLAGARSPRRSDTELRGAMT